MLDTFAPSHIIRHPASISIAHNCDSYLLPRITKSPSSIIFSIISGLAAAIIIFPLLKCLSISPVITSPLRVSTILLRLVPETDNISLSYISKYDLATSLIVTSPFSLSSSMIGSVSTPLSFINFHAFLTERASDIPLIFLTSISLT